MATSTPPEMENTYFYLNNLVNIPPVDGEIPLYYDQEALKAILKRRSNQRLNNLIHWMPN